MSASIWTAFQPLRWMVAVSNADVQEIAGHDAVCMVSMPEHGVAAYGNFVEGVALMCMSVQATATRAQSRTAGTVGMQSQLNDGVAVRIPHAEGLGVLQTPIGHHDWLRRSFPERCAPPSAPTTGNLA